MDISKLLFVGKNSPLVNTETTITKGFTSGGEHFTQIYFYEDGEIWYVNSNGSAQAFANGVWEIEYKSIVFDDNVSLTDSEYDVLFNAYDTANSKIGSVGVDDLYVGSGKVNFVALGNNLVFAKKNI